jgi:integrase
VGKRRPVGSGTVRQLASGRWQARFRGGDDVLRPAPVTFDSKLDAAAWLRGQAADLERGVWQAPVRAGASTATTLEDYAHGWLEGRDLKPRTRLLYAELLSTLILPALGRHRLDKITPAMVRAWHATLDPDAPTRRAHAYSLLRSIYTTAVADDLAATNPCRIRGAGASRKQHRTRVASLAELEVITAAMPDRLRAMVTLAAWCGLRFGELAELRRDDLDLDAGHVRVERAMTARDGQLWIGTPKSEAGTRRVSIPPHLVPTLADHLQRHVPPAGDSLLFPAQHGGHLARTTLQGPWVKARAAAGREDLRFHDLRHTGATLAAATGATLADLMARLGHSTTQAAMRYQHAAQDRDAAIAEALSGFAQDNVVPLRRVGGR